MVLFRGTSDLDDCRGGIVAIGNFDGVHLGHQSMMAALRRQADAAGVPAVAMTFEPPPVELLRPHAAPPRLMRLDRKAACLEAAGADCVLALATDRPLLDLSADEFFREVLINQLAVRGLVEGQNFRFGRGREGDVSRLQSLCESSGLQLTIVEPVQIEGRTVSSSLIRQAVVAGELPEAARLLGRPHEVIGIVERGADRGAGLGFPTANLSGTSTLLPPDGVYAARTEVDGCLYVTAVHLGANSTFGEEDRKLEAHLLDFSGDLYGRRLRVELIDKVRETSRFESAAALVEQLQADCRRVRELVATASKSG